MECPTAREVVSVRLDGEDVGIDPTLDGAVDTHLASCGGCARWAEDASRLRRHVTMTVPAPAPDLSGQILAAAMPARVARRSRRLRRERVLRAVLAGAGLLLIAGVLVVVGLGPDVVQPAEHLTSTTGFWAGIVGIGFLVVAVFPRRVFLMTPILCTAAAFLLIASLDDLINHHVHPIHEAPTVIAVVGIIALVLLFWPRRYVGAAGSNVPGPTTRGGLSVGPRRQSTGRR